MNAADEVGAQLVQDIIAALSKGRVRRLRASTLRAHHHGEVELALVAHLLLLHVQLHDYALGRSSRRLLLAQAKPGKEIGRGSLGLALTEVTSDETRETPDDLAAGTR